MREIFQLSEQLLLIAEVAIAEIRAYDTRL